MNTLTQTVPAGIDLGIEEQLADAVNFTKQMLADITVARLWVGANSAVQMGVVTSDRSPNGFAEVEAEEVE